MLAVESKAFHAPHVVLRSAGPSLSTTAAEAVPIVFLAVDEACERESISQLVLSAGWQPQRFSTTQEFLARARRWVPSCLLVVHAMPRLDGLKLQREVADERPDLPVVFVTDCTDLRVAVQAMQAGALEFLAKPQPETTLIEAIGEALERSGATLDQERQLDALRCRYRSLSPRERDVMRLVATGLLNKQVGAELGISEITVKAHRGRVMRKMKATSLPHLVTMAARLGIDR